MTDDEELIQKAARTMHLEECTNQDYCKCTTVEIEWYENYARAAAPIFREAYYQAGVSAAYLKGFEDGSMGSNELSEEAYRQGREDAARDIEADHIWWEQDGGIWMNKKRALRIARGTDPEN